VDAERLADGRGHRRDQTGWATGAACFLALGAVAGALVPGIDRVLGAVVGAVLGAGAGALLGVLLARRVAVEEFDPERGERPYVGASSPDADT
jgi:hypothetical protein